MRIVVLAGLGLLLVLALWLGGDGPEEATGPDVIDPSAAGPELQGRPQPLEAGPRTDGGLEVLVRRRGRSEAGARVVLRRLDPDQIQALEDGLLDLRDLPVHASGTTAGSGRAHLRNVAAGTYSLAARAADGGYGSLLVDARSTGGLQVVVVDLLAGAYTLRGRLVDGARPARGWQVQLRLSSDQDEVDTYEEEQPVWAATPSADGRFTFGALPHGRYVVRAVQPGRTSMAFQSILLPNSVEHVFDVGLHELSLRGVVKDSETDAPIAGAVVRFGSVSEGCSRMEVLRTDQEGRFAARVGNWSDEVRVEAPGYGPRVLHGRGLEDASPLVVHLARVGRVMGRVVAAAGGAPQAGVGVCLFRWREGAPDARWTQADAEGRFVFEEVPPGVVNVFVLGSGLCSAAFDVATRDADPTVCRVQPGETTTLTVAAQPTMTLRARVLDAGGAPVAGARIVPNEYMEIRRLLVVHRQPTPHTDAEGYVEFADLVPGSHFGVEVWIDGRPQGDGHLYVDGASEPAVIRLEEMRRYVVEVLDAATGEPIPDAAVRVDDARAAYMDRPWLTDAAGRVHFELADDYFSVESIHAAGYVPLQSISAGLVPASSDTPSDTYRLVRGETLAGRVHLPADVPASAVLLSLEVGEGEWEGDTHYADLDAEGRFVFQGVPPGTHLLEAWSQWRGRGYETELEAAAGARDVELHLAPEEEHDIVKLRVRVRDERGRPLVRGLAWLFVTKANVLRSHIAHVHDGWTTFRNSGAAPRWLVVTPTHDATGLKPNLMPSLHGPLDMGLGQLDVVLRGGRTVRGRVTDTAGRPIAGVELHVTVDWRIGADPKPKTIFVTEAHTDAGGHFELTGLPDDDVKVHVWQVPLGWTKPKPSHVGSGSATWNLELEPAARATIRVVDWRGNPVNRARVRWVPRREGWKDADVEDQLTDNRGYAEFGHLRPDEPVDLIVVPPDDRKDCLTYRLKPAPLASRTVRLPRGHALEVTVLDRAGHPVKNATIWRNSGSGWWARGSTDERGVQTLERVPEGEIALRADHRRRPEGTVVHVAGDAGSCTIRIGD